MRRLKPKLYFRAECVPAVDRALPGSLRHLRFSAWHQSLVAGSVVPVLSKPAGAREPKAYVTFNISGGDRTVDRSLKVARNNKIPLSQLRPKKGEYQLNRRWSVSVVRNESGGVAVDGRFHTNF
jgi:hypothetical protein